MMLIWVILSLVFYLLVSYTNLYTLYSIYNIYYIYTFTSLYTYLAIVKAQKLCNEKFSYFFINLEIFQK